MSQRAKVLCCCVLLSMLVLAGCQRKGEEKKQAPASLSPVSVHLVTVERENIGSVIEVMGTVAAENRAMIGAKVSGTIVKMPVKLGDRVKKGDLLVKISAEEIAAKVLQAQAQLAQAKRSLEKERKLLRQNAATPEGVKNLEDMARVAEAVYHEAVTMQGYTEIRAPFSGLITSKSASVGDLAGPGQPLLQLENDTSFQVLVAVPESLLLPLRLGDELAVTVPAPGLQLHGKVAEVAPAIDSQSRTAQVKIDLGHHDLLRAGQFARVALPGSAGSGLFVPRSAVRRIGQMEEVLVAMAGAARLRLVRTGSQTGERVEILAGLQEGDQVIVDNIDFMRDGQPVTRAQ